MKKNFSFLFFTALSPILYYIVQNTFKEYFMKKMFLAALTALALCNYTYAQDDEEEYEEEDAPARVEAPAADDEEDEAPAKPAKAAKKAKSDGSAFLGFGMGLTSNFNDLQLKQIDVKVKLNENMMVTGIIGLYHHGETSTETKAGGATVETDAGDNYTGIAIGAGFDYFLPMPLLPASAGIDLIYVSNGETETVDAVANTTTTASSGDFLIDLMFGVHAEIVPNMILTAKVGLGFDYTFSSTEVSSALATVTVDNSRFDFGLKAGVYASWFFM